MRRVVAVGRENRRDLWAALAPIREAVEAMAPVGAMRSSEAVMARTGRNRSMRRLNSCGESIAEARRG